MRSLLRLAAFLTSLAGPAYAQFPSPTFSMITVAGAATPSTMGGQFNFSGAVQLNGGGALNGHFNGVSSFSNITPTLAPVTVATLGTVSPSGPGTLVYVSDCINGSQTAPGSGCPYFWDGGSWRGIPYIPNSGLTVGGQTVFLGGSTSNQGNGPKIQLSSGAITSGHCVQFDANGNTVDAGSACGGGGGGSGTVTAGLANQLGVFAVNGSTISGLTTAASGVLVTNGSGVPSISSTLPSGMAATSITLTTPTMSGATLTGTTTAAAIMASGEITTPASTTGTAGFNLPHGVAPTSPVNGDMWTTSAGGLFLRVNGATKGSFVTAATAPLTDVNGTVALGVQPSGYPLFFDSTVTVHNDTYQFEWVWATGTITDVEYYTGGSSTPSFSVAIQIAGTPVTSCSAISVSSATPANTSCTAANTVTRGQFVSVVITNTSGTPFSSLVQVNYTRSAS